MPGTFLIDEEVHAAGDSECPACPPDYPEPCRCGGLMHASGETDEESETIITTQCDKCGRSVEDLEGEVA